MSPEGWDTLGWPGGSHQPGRCRGPRHEALALLLMGQELPGAVDAAGRCTAPMRGWSGPATGTGLHLSALALPFVTAPPSVSTAEIQRSHLSLLRAKPFPCWWKWHVQPWARGNGGDG